MFLRRQNSSLHFVHDWNEAVWIPPGESHSGSKFCLPFAFLQCRGHVSGRVVLVL